MIEYNEKESGFKKVIIIILILIAGIVILNKNELKIPKLKIPEFKVSSIIKSRNDMKVLISEHFKNKYGEYNVEFIDDGEQDDLFSKEVRFYINTESYPDNYYIYAIYNTETNEITDNYFDFTMKEKVEKELDPIIQKIYPKSYFEYTTHGHVLSNDVKGELTFEEYISSIDYPLEVTIVIPIKLGKESDLNLKDIKVYELGNKFKERNIRCTLEIVYAYDYVIAANSPLDIEDAFYNEDIFMLKGRFYQNERMQYDELNWEKPVDNTEEMTDSYTTEW